MRSWFVIYTKPQQEFRAAQELRNQEFEAYLPLLSLKPLFPRYLFCRFDREVDAWGKISSTRGCIGLIRNGNLPQPLHDGVIEAVMAFREATEAQDGHIEFHKGQVVRIKTGLLAGYEGLFEGSDKQRVKAFLEILGNRVEVPMKDIAPAA